MERETADSAGMLELLPGGPLNAFALMEAVNVLDDGVVHVHVTPLPGRETCCPLR